MSTAYLIVEDPDGARYAVPADGVQRHPGAKVIGREGDTGVPQPLEPETAPEPEQAPAPEGVPAEQAPAPTEQASAPEAADGPPAAAGAETPETPAP